MKKYGVDNELKNKEIREKVKNTKIKLFGSEHVTQNEDVKEKGRETSMVKYGVDHPMKNKHQASSIKRHTNANLTRFLLVVLNKFKVMNPFVLAIYYFKEKN
jgi:hypothetical protein